MTSRLHLFRIAAAQATAYETLYSFQGSPDGGDPLAALVIGKDDALYGTTYTGGASGRYREPDFRRHRSVLRNDLERGTGAGTVQRKKQEI